MTKRGGTRSPLKQRQAYPRGGTLRRQVPLPEPDCQRELERDRRGRQGEDAEACRGLWIAVIQRALRDVLWLQENGWTSDEEMSSKHEELLAYDPAGFLRSRRFDRICALIDLRPTVVRELLEVDDILARPAA